MKKFLYHQWTLSDVERYFEVSHREGLNEAKIKVRQDKYGPNSFVGLKERSTGKILIGQFFNFFTILLLTAAIISFIVGSWSDAIILIGIIILNIAISFFQEHKAEKSLSALKRTMSYKNKVLREGEILEIDSSQIVPGDVAILSEGNRVPADIYLCEEESLRVNESSLTGESTPISKKVCTLDIAAPLAERSNMVFCGTTIYSGRAKGVVVAIAKETEYGKIAKMISHEEEKTPLEKRVLYIGRYLSYVAGAVTLIIFISGLVRGWPILELTRYIIAVLVSAVPESLPTVITLALAVGVIGMVKKKAVVRRLGVIEALGSINIIATDKTGTLTQNKLEVSNLVYLKNGKMWHDKEIQQRYSKDVLFYASLCSDVSGEKAGQFIGDPLEVVFFDRLFKVDREKFATTRLFKRDSETPFSSDNKYMMVRGRIGGNNYMIVKGATERVIKFCSLKSDEEKEILSANREITSLGSKVIAVAVKKLNKRSASDLKSMEFLGILGLSDQPAEGVSEAIKKTEEAGIRLIVITGDDPKTAKYIAGQIGLEVDDNQIISGDQISDLSDLELEGKLKNIKIFARATPEDKIRIVNVLERMKYSVVVTGDGVNDAPALKAATVGVAMGIRGSDVSKEASDIILTDDNYATIVEAIAWGRRIYDNIKNALIFLLAGNFDELFLIALTFILGLPAPFTAIQILWINLVTDSLPAISLAFEKPNPKILKQNPRSHQASAISPSIWYAVVLGTFSLIVSIVLYLWGLHYSVDKARTLAYLTAIMCEMVFILSIRAQKRIWQDFRGFFENRYLLVAIVISIILGLVAMIPRLQPFFGTTILNLSETIALICGVLIAFIMAETFRFFYDRHNFNKR